MWGWRPSAREQDQDLGQPPVEGLGVGRPAEAPRAGSRTAPARSGRSSSRRVAEVAQLAARDRVDARLVDQESGASSPRRLRGGRPDRPRPSRADDTGGKPAPLRRRSTQRGRRPARRLADRQEEPPCLVGCVRSGPVRGPEPCPCGLSAAPGPPPHRRRAPRRRRRRRAPRPAPRRPRLARPARQSATAGTVKVSIENFAFNPPRSRPRSATPSRSPTATAPATRPPSTTARASRRPIASGQERRPDVHGRGDVPVPLQDPLDDEGHDHRQLSLAATLARRSAPAPGRPQRRSTSAGARPRTASRRTAGRSAPASGRPASANQSRNCSRVASAVPWYSSSSWTPAISSPWRRPELVRRRRQRPVEDDDPAAGPERRPRRAQRADRVGQLVEGVLEVGEVVRRAPRPAWSTSAWRISIRSASPAAATLARARATESGSNSTPTSSRSGNRRAIAMSQRPPPQWMSTTRPPRDRSATSCGSSASASWKKTAMSWHGQALDRGAIAVGSVADRLPGPEELEHPAPVERRDRPHGRTGRRGTRAGRRRGGRSRVVLVERDAGRPRS